MNWRLVFYAREIVSLVGDLIGLFRAETKRDNKRPVRNMVDGVTIENRGAGRQLVASDFGVGKITRFRPSDLGVGWRNVSALAAYRLNQFLNALSYPARITSAWRSAAKNRDVGGASNSRHLTGEAFDVEIDDPKFFSRSRLDLYLDLARQSGFKGVGLYEGERVIHVDVRSRQAGWGKVLRNGKLVFVSIAKFLDQYGASAVGVFGLLIAVGVFFFLLASTRDGG